jgi:hypothetical protein
MMQYYMHPAPAGAPPPNTYKAPEPTQTYSNVQTYPANPLLPPVLRCNMEHPSNWTLLPAHKQLGQEVLEHAGMQHSYYSNMGYAPAPPAYTTVQYGRC